MRKIAVVICLTTFLGAACPIFGASEIPVKKDIDRDGFKEAEIYYAAPGVIDKMLVDTDHDGRADRTYFYKKGIRERADMDTNFDGHIETWIDYDFSGAVRRVSKDLNAAGSADYWQYYKNGVRYRWDRDRNHDGRVDRRTFFTEGAYRSGKRRGNLIKRIYDNDFDGNFDGLETAKRPENIPLPGSLAESRYRS